MSLVTKVSVAVCYFVVTTAFFVITKFNHMTFSDETRNKIFVAKVF